MDRLFTFLQTYRSGILLLLFGLASIALLVQWFAWILGKGRFGKDAVSGSKAVTFIFSDAIVKIINEFRHLLALLIVVIFAFALGYSLIKAASLPTGTGTPSVIDNMKEALQAVVATLGGLVGSIIGYYFGESSTAKPPDTRPQTPAPDASPITAVTPPTQAASADTIEDS